MKVGLPNQPWTVSLNFIKNSIDCSTHYVFLDVSSVGSLDGIRIGANRNNLGVVAASLARVMQPITIRPGTSADAFAIAMILRESGWFEHLNSESAATTTERVAQHINLCLADDSHSLFVAEVSAQPDNCHPVVGYALVHWLPYLFLPAPEGFLSELFVDSDHRGNGIGKQLLTAVTTAARKRGCARLMLANGRNRPSYQRGFYQKQGWVEREAIANFIYKL
jgi:GNAT superfamily N-acetyltransferase